MTLWDYLSDPTTAAAAREFAATEVAPEADRIDHDDLYPSELVKKTAERGWNSMTLPQEFGGSGAPMSSAVGVFEELGAASASLAVSLITIFQSQKIVQLYGTDSLQRRVLPRYAKGLRASYALTEAGHGSDIRSLDTKAVRSSDGWTINGAKAFITSGSAADFFIVLAETPLGVSTFAVDRDTPGISTHHSRNAETFGLRNGPHIDLILEDVVVPHDALIGEEGNGLRQAMVTLSNSRTLAAGIQLGIARAAFDAALKHVASRPAFGGMILDFQGIQWYLADAAAELDAARLMTYRAADDLDNGGDYQRSSSAAKLLAGTVATKVAGLAVQICGAHGTQETSPFGRYLRDAKTYEVAGGSNEVLKNTIAKALVRSTK